MEKTYVVTIRGMGGHASMPQKANNPILIAAGLVSSIAGIHWLQPEKTKNKELTAEVKAVSILAGEKGNIIPDEASVRYHLKADTNHFRKLKEQFIHAVNVYTEIRGAKAEINIETKEAKQ